MVRTRQFRLVAVNIEVEVFLRQFVVGTVFTQFSESFVKGRLQLGIVFTQADPGAVAEIFFVFD